MKILWILLERIFSPTIFLWLFCERSSFFSGCQDARNMISIVEIKCPKCGADIEVFVRDGKTVGDSVCDQCGYTIKENQNI